MTKKKDEATTLPAVTTFQIACELEAIRGKLEAAEGELEEGDFEALKKWEAALEVKAENICFFLESLKAQEALYAEMERRAYDRRARIKAAHDRLKNYLRDAMQFSGTKSIKKKDGLFSVSLVDGRTSAKVQDPGKLPAGTYNIEEVIKPDLKEIKRRLDAGEDVPGAVIETGQPFLTIR